MNSFIKSIYLGSFFFKSVTAMFENEFTVSGQELEPLQQNVVQAYHCHLSYLLSRTLVEEDIKAKNNGTDPDSNLGLCLLHSKKKLWKYFTEREQNCLKVRWKMPSWKAWIYSKQMMEKQRFQCGWVLRFYHGDSAAAIFVKQL